MARREITMNEIVELIYQWHQGAGFKSIRRSLGFDRKTIRKYVQVGQEAGVQRGELFPAESDLVKRLKNLSQSELLRETPAQDLLDPHQEWFQELLQEEQMTAKQVWRLYQERTETAIGYCTVKRYLRARLGYRAPRVTVRLEVVPGSQAQVDFGYMGRMVDPETGALRKTWAFIMTLSFSRHRFVRFVFRQDVATWIDCHIRAFEFFNGVPETIILDNLKAGVVKPDLYDPTLNRAYGDLERHYSFVADPAKVGEPRHKGKVERVVPVVRQQLVAGRNFRDIEEANTRAPIWCTQEVGMEIHGTTKRRPYEVFQAEERPHLKPLPRERFECPLWKGCTVHPDHHIVFDRSYYSLPTRFIGRKVWARGTSRLVQVLLNEELVKTHLRALKPGTWRTDPADYPPEKLAYLMPAPTFCRHQAAAIGPETEKLVTIILQQHALKNLRKVQGLLGLAKKYGPAAMERAATRTLFFGNLRMSSIKTILEKGWAVPEPPAAIVWPRSPLGERFLRPPTYFIPEPEVLQ